MESQSLVARSRISINASVESVWEALVNPEIIRKYMFDTTVTTDWKQGSPISWKGYWQGRQYEDRGTILSVVPGQTLQYTHYSPLSGLAETPENYHTVTIHLKSEQNRTEVSLSQDNNKTEEEQIHSEKNWFTMLQALKELLEKTARQR